jgi:TetR/AcrR family transcriptional regulator, regulator of autoinduction and epiphytic fitness
MSRDAFIKNRAAEKREAILVAARQRFAVEGYERSSTEKIARDAQVSTATLFRQFPTKLDLFAAVLSDGIGDFEDQMKIAKGADLSKRLNVLAHAYGRLLDQPNTAGVMRAILSAAPTSPEIAATFYDKVKLVVGGAFFETIAKLAEQGILREKPDLSIAAGQLMGMIEHATLWRRMLSGKDATEDTSPQIDAALQTFWTRWGKAS